jgi:LuxR family maltose regulon positive regulatory protein
MDSKEHLIRPRINTLLAHAIKHTLTIIHGGMGCGKTRAVYDFARECAFPVLWMQFSDSRNTSLHFWDCFVRALAQINKPFAKESKRLGFPDTADKVAMYLTLRDRMQEDIRRIYVLDDFHFVKDAAVLNFTEKCIYNAPKNISYILISRELPHINIAMASAIGKVYMISEDELNFTENEIHQFLLQQELSSETNSVPKIYKDTNGWAIIINFLARILKKTPGYAGYASNAIKQDISQLIATEIWNVISERLQRFFLRLSLTEHRSMDLVKVLAEGNSHLISELQQQNAFVRYDRYTDSYRIHRLFLNFLYDKQDLLTADEIRNTYTIIAEWCVSNDYIFDALFTYEKMGDYASITSILFASPVEFFEKYSLHIVNIFNRAPKKIFDHVEYSAAVHIHLTLCTDAWPKTLALTQHYEAKYLQLPEDNALRSRMLGCIYYYLGILHMLLCKANHYYDFDKYFAKQYEYLKNFPVNPKCWYQHPPSIWTNFVGSARAGAPQEYINALTRSMKYIHKCINGLGAGLDNLCQGELFFYQCKIRETEFNLSKAMQRAQEHQQHEIISRVLFLIMRIAVFQGDYAKLTLALQDAERLLACNEYSTRFLTYDVVAGWHYCLLGQPERTPGWLKDQFSFRLPTHTLENLGNYTKTTYCYLVGN